MTTFKNLKSLREDSSLTARHVAVIMGCTQPNVTVIESGARSSRVNTVAKYCAAVGRDDLASLLRPLLSAEDWNDVRVISSHYDALAEGFRKGLHGAATRAVPRA